MSDHAHTDNFTGLETLDPATIPATDAKCFRQIRAARANLDQAEADLREAVASAHDAGDSWIIIGAALETTRQATHQRFGRD